MICNVCMHHCNLKEGQTGRCRVRMNKNGRNISINYGQITGFALDPIEKKPLACFYPNSMILSVGSFGCNLSCPFCQNASISMIRKEEADTEYLSPEELAAENAHVEITTLIIPGENDTEEEIAGLSAWIAAVNADIPLHLTRFFPRWKMQDKKPTNIELLYRLKQTAEKNLKRVFIGNV